MQATLIPKAPKIIRPQDVDATDAEWYSAISEIPRIQPPVKKIERRVDCCATF